MVFSSRLHIQLPDVAVAEVSSACPTVDPELRTITSGQKP